MMPLPPRDSRGRFTKVGGGGGGGGSGGQSLANLVATIQADPSPFYRSLAGVRGALFGLGAELSKFRIPIGEDVGLGGLFRGLKTGLIALAPVTAGLGFAAKTSIEFESALVRLAKATDLTDAQVADLDQALKGLAAEMRILPIDQVYQIATAGAKLGKPTDQLLSYTRGIIKLTASIDDLPANVIADEIGKIDVIFKLGSRGAEQLGSAIDKLDDSSIASASGILDVTQRISGSASAAKLSAQETVALGAALLETGTHAEAAAGALIQLLQGLNNIEHQKGFAKTIGVSAEAFAKQVRDKPIEAIGDFLKALDSLDAGAQQEALESIGIEGTRGGGNLQKLGQQFDKLRQFVEFANHEFITLEHLNQSFQKEAASTRAALTGLWIQVQTAADRIGDELNPAIRRGTEVLGTIVNRIPALVDAFRELSNTEWASKLGESFGTVLKAGLPFLALFEGQKFSAGGFFDGLIAGIQDFDLVLTDTVLSIQQFGLGLEDALAASLGVTSAQLDYGVQLFESFGDRVYNAFVHLHNRSLGPLGKLTDAIGLISGPLGLIGDLAFGNKPLEFAPVRKPEFKAPDFKFAEDPNLKLAREANQQELQRRADERADRKKAAVVGPGGATAAQQQGAKTGGLAAGEPKAPQLLGLEEFASKLLLSGLDKNSAQERTARAAEQTRDEIKGLRADMKKPVVGALPAVSLEA